MFIFRLIFSSSAELPRGPEISWQDGANGQAEEQHAQTELNRQSAGQ